MNFIERSGKRKRWGRGRGMWGEEEACGERGFGTGGFWVSKGTLMRERVFLSIS